MVQGRTEPGGLPGQDHLHTGRTGPAPQAVDQEPDGPRIEVSGRRLFQELIDGAPWVEGLRPVRPRRNLLRGLMDTDGDCDKRHGRATLCTTKPALLAGASELIRSLGLVPTITEQPAK